MVQAGDAIPSVELHEGAPDKKVNLSQELASGKGLIIGMYSLPLVHLLSLIVQH